MLRGERTGLRARHEDDIPVLESELYNDVETLVRADSRPWRPLSPGSAQSPYRLRDDATDSVAFSVVELASDELVGEALLWGIDQHNRLAHVGISLRPAFRGRGLAADAVRVLCRYGFATLGLPRLPPEPLAAHLPTIAPAP